MEETVSKRQHSQLEISDDSIKAKKMCLENAEDNSTKISAVEVTEVTSISRVTEADVGITEYISIFPGFHAVMKERYSDFLVNEIDLSGNVVHLTSMEKPVTHEDNIELEKVVDEKTAADLQSLIDLETKEVLINVTDKDKNERKLIHEAIRKSYPDIESITVDKDGEKFIIAKKIDKKVKGRRFKPSSAGNYLHFVMYKENRDTMDAINTISSFLRIHSKAFSYAGTKDKRAKTSQLVSAYRTSPEKLLSINKKFNMIKVGNFMYKNDQIKLGDLLGNQFTIILRQLQGNDELIEKSMNSLASKGFINYYGCQRFGTSSVSTHSIGRALLQSDWKSAINLILKPRSEGDDNMAACRKIWMETKDAKLAYENLRNKSSIEGKLLHGLSTNNENDFINALNAIPRNTRLMYIHSYQSYIWNKVVSKRIQKFGLNVLIGDLISKTNCDKECDMDFVENNKKTLSVDVDFVTEDNIKNITISDILMPLPGYSIVYPKNETEEFYEFYLKEENMAWGNFESKVKAYSLSGAYRKIIVKPSDVQWEVLSYEDNSKPLALSDLDVLSGISLDNSSNSGSLQALKMQFKLPPSSYATMAVREMLKCNTSYSFT